MKKIEKFIYPDLKDALDKLPNQCSASAIITKRNPGGIWLSESENYIIVKTMDALLLLQVNFLVTI